MAFPVKLLLAKLSFARVWKEGFCYENERLCMGFLAVCSPVPEDGAVLHHADVPGAGVPWVFSGWV